MKSIYFKIILIVIVLFQFGCSDNKGELKPSVDRLIITESFKINVAEPSGLSFAFEEDAIWTVSDQNSTIYKLSLMGDVIDKITVKYNDLEGVTVVDSSRLAIVAEEERKIAIIDLSGEVIKELRLRINGEYNKGLEGLVFNPVNKHFYVVNEKYPAMLIELNTNFEVINEKEITFLNDLSGISYDKDKNQLILLSDENNELAICDLKGNLIKKYKFNIQQAEGVCFRNGELFIVSDPKSEMYKFKL